MIFQLSKERERWRYTQRKIAHGTMNISDMPKTGRSRLYRDHCIFHRTNQSFPEFRLEFVVVPYERHPHYSLSKHALRTERLKNSNLSDRWNSNNSIGDEHALCISLFCPQVYYFVCVLSSQLSEFNIPIPTTIHL